MPDPSHIPPAQRQPAGDRAVSNIEALIELLARRSDIDNPQCLHALLDRNGKVSEAGKALLTKLGIDGEFSVIADTEKVLTLGNKDRVLKLSKDSHYTPDTLLMPDAVHPDFAATTYGHETLGGFVYSVSERLDTTRVAAPGEILSFLFRLREEGRVYTEAYSGKNTPNLGFDHNGNLKALDLKYFERLDADGRNFTASLITAASLISGKLGNAPRVSTHDGYTYVVLSPSGSQSAMPSDGAQRQQMTHLLASLHAAGVSEADIQAVNGTPVIRIARTEINDGEPPQRQSLASFIDNSVFGVSDIIKAEDFHKKLAHMHKRAVDKFGDRVQALEGIFPDAATMAKLSRDQFMEMSGRYLAAIDGLSLESWRSDALEDHINSYFKNRYSPKRQQPLPQQQQQARPMPSAEEIARQASQQEAVTGSSGTHLSTSQEGAQQGFSTAPSAPDSIRASVTSHISAGPDAANNSTMMGHAEVTGNQVQGATARKLNANYQSPAPPQPQFGETTKVGAGHAPAANEVNPNLQPVQITNVGTGKVSAANVPTLDAAPPKTPAIVAPYSGHIAANATRTGGAAGATMGAMGIAARLGDSLTKAERVGGKQLETERAALVGDGVSVVTGLSDLTPEAAQAASKAGAALRTMGRIAPIVAAGAAYLEVQAANTAQDGRRGAGAIGGFLGGMGVGMATGAAAGAIFGPWGAAIGGIIGGLGAGYVGSEIGRTSQWGDQRQRDLDHKAQYALDQSVEVIAEIGRKRLRGEAWTEADKAAIRTIGGLMVEHVNRMQVLEIPATDVDGRLRQQYQIQQTQHVIDYLNGKTERLPMASQQRDAHLIPSIDALLPELNDLKLGWKHWLHPSAGEVDRNDVLRILAEYGVELHTLDKDGRKGVTIDELTTVLKSLKVDQRGKVTPARGAAHVERPPEINDETHENFRDGLTEKSGNGQKRFEAAMASWIPELEKAGFGKTIGGPDGKMTLEKLGEAMKRSGLRASEVDQDGNGNITEREAINALRAHGLDRPPPTPQPEASQASNPQIRR